MHSVNIFYLITSDMYKGFRPFDGETQIFSPVIEDGLAGGHGNPLSAPQTAI